MRAGRLSSTIVALSVGWMSTLVVPCGALGQVCFDNSQCDWAWDWYCEKTPGDCWGMGVCAPRPDVCTDDVAPVCGCDGRTYSNACRAAVWGVNVAYFGGCVGDTVSLTSAASRKTHAGAGVFDINLPLWVSSSAVEHRTGGPTEVVLSFSAPIRAVDGQLDCSEVELSSGTCVDVGILANGMTVHLSGAATEECLTIAVHGIRGLSGRPLVGDNDVTVRVLPGDQDGSGTVNIVDLNNAKGDLWAPVTDSTFYSDINADGAIDIADLQAIKGGLFARLPRCPYVECFLGYSNSGCKHTFSAEENGWCEEDTFEMTVDGSTVTIVHRNATYNCCPDEIAISLVANGGTIQLSEDEVLSMPCACLCCYDITSAVGGLMPGTYTVEYCWDDYDTPGGCHVQQVVVP